MAKEREPTTAVKWIPNRGRWAAVRNARDQRRHIREADERLTEIERDDWALIHAVSQRDWYSNHMDRARWKYASLETIGLLLAGVTTVMAALNVIPALTAVVAAAATFAAGLRQLFSWNEDWMAFSDAWAACNGFISEYRTLPASQRGDSARRKLVQDIDRIVSVETSRWSERRRRLLQS